jgi:hypothetical protein
LSADLRYNKSSCLTDKRKTPFSSEKFTSPFFSSVGESADSASTSLSSFSFSFNEKYNQDTRYGIKSTENTEIDTLSKITRNERVFGSFKDHAKVDNTRIIEKISKTIQVQKFLKVSGLRLWVL